MLTLCLARMEISDRPGSRIGGPSTSDVLEPAFALVLPGQQHSHLKGTPAMCYSSKIWADYRKFVRAFGATIDVDEFTRVYWLRSQGGSVKIPKAMDAPFEGATEGSAAEAARLIAEWNAQQGSALEQMIFTQKTRLNTAERSLQTRVTKKAQEDIRIASNKIAAAQAKLADLRRPEPRPEDSRIFPGQYGLVMVAENGRRVVKPMRYQCRPCGRPAFYDAKFPGTYNARRDSLEGFWKSQFGHTHGLMVAENFYENVQGADGKNQVLQFTPRTGEPMLIACLWSRWGEDEDTLLSFAAITDEPEPEIADAGHDRTIINIKSEHIDAWLNPEPGNLNALYSIFDDRQHPYYEHRLAA